ncbi:hypothetical protein RIN67_12725 (plasmid) [Levilactobacillus namurensis]|uniref:hypothetical protein n=1 Tax=Levilactobacillus namurensis TaxID=380393 RepID=UPI0028BCF53E|nr:hypothetical protein [Levilactobacillus namurensis]MDT7020128.1 hypothetical protein [Levilactobacillus namurensis]WNN66784.1 hypothetical protein RIN67_12725 [Levilactobacillus namurensis]
MSSNKKMAAAIREAYANYGDDPDDWPEDVKKEIRGQTEEEHTAENNVLRHMILHGYTNKYIAQERSNKPKYIQQLRDRMRKRDELDYQATPDELTQLKYNVKHMNKPNNKGVASVMHRDKDWVRCMREKLREAANEAR